MFYIMKINNFRGDRTHISAKKEALVQTYETVQADHKRLHRFVRLVDYVLVENQIDMLERNMQSLHHLYKSVSMLHCAVSFHGPSFSFDPSALLSPFDHSRPVLIFQQKHRLAHPENYLFSLSKYMFSGSKYPENISSNFENRSTALVWCFSRSSITLVWCCASFLKIK